MTKADDAHRSFISRFTCSAAVFSTFSKELGLDPDTAKKIACGFGGGISHTGNMCGAVSGAIMVIGLAYGKTETDDDAATHKTRSLTRRLMNEFARKNGSINCTELLGYNLSNPDELARARDEEIFVTKCPMLVRDATEIVENILKNEGRERT